MKNSDYKKKRTNLNALVPGVVQTTFLKTLNENTFNRFFSAAEFEHVVGLIGDLNPNDPTTFRIPEKRPQWTASQLQPVPYVRIGSIDKQMSFEDMMSRLKLAGVDTESFSTWGRSRQFNWVPPINLDKLVNYREYFWELDSVDDKPEYITIKNQQKWANARFKQAKKSVFEVMAQHSVDSVINNTIRLKGNKAAMFRAGSFIVTTQDNNYGIYQVVSSTFNNASLKTELLLDAAPGSVEYISTTELSLIFTNVADNTFTVSGDLTLLLRKGFVVRTASGLEPSSYFTVLESTYNLANGTTVIKIAEDITSVNYTRLDLLPLLSLMRGEVLSLSTAPNEYRSALYTPPTLLTAGEMIWVREYGIMSDANGAYVENGGAILTDENINFSHLEVLPGDIINIRSGVNRGTYPILSVSEHIVNIDTGVSFFFADASITYEIYRNRPFSTLGESIDRVNAVKYDAITDSILVFDGSDWVTSEKAISRLLINTNGKHRVNRRQTDDWSSDNRWYHKTQVTDFQNMVRAQLPIIEFDPYLELANYSYTAKDWSYRKTEAAEYIAATNNPTLFELHDIRILDGDEFLFRDNNTIELHHKFGFMGDSLKSGDSIRLSGFGVNSGVYTVTGVEFSPVSVTTRFRTVITIAEPLKDITDAPEGAYIGPKLTANGDEWLGFEAAQWRLNGVLESVASGITKEVNPEYDQFFNTSYDNETPFDSVSGLNWQLFRLRDNATTGPTLEFNTILHDLVLREDYQEGDIRVYINGVRQYGNFSDLASDIQADYAGAIKFDDDVLITRDDLIRVELGEHVLTDIGKRAVPTHTVNGIEYTNIVDYRKMEQEKTVNNQNPLFSVFTSTGEAVNAASEIFTYEENPSYDINPYILKRITNGTEIGFTQKLMNDDGSLLWYKDTAKNAAPTSTIWRKGLNNETYAPIKVDGNWELPNQLTYNVHHENRNVVRFSEIYRHFRSIIEAQEVPGIFTKDGQVYHLDDNINFGIGGTIKEHNGGFDMLVSAMFVEDVSPVDVIQFAHDQYNDQINWFKERLRTKAATLLVSDDTTIEMFTTNIANKMLSAFENDKNLDRLFGDSSSPVRNWVASLCYLGLGKAVKPYVLNDATLGINEIVHHTGHRSEVSLNRAETELLLRGLIKRGVATSQTVPNHSVDLTTTGLETTGQLLVRTAPTGSKLYRYTVDSNWEHLDLNGILSNAILTVENKLYENAPVISRNVNSVVGNALYTSKIEEGFNRYVVRNGIANPFINKDGYSSGDPFTWNYAFSKLIYNPSTTKTFSALAGSWQGLYQQVYGTPYPHLEPWVLQGFDSEPSWWSAVYANTDATSGRRWVETMWDNILAGIVPDGGTTPIGAVGNGFPGQTPILFTSVPVNTGSLPTSDNIRPDDLIPPYWNTSNTTDSRVKPLFDANQQHDVVTPQLDYAFGINGVWEWKWRNSLQYKYDKLITTFQLDPMNFINAVFDAPLVDVNCLEIDGLTTRVRSHRDVVFHGDFVDAMNSNYISNGLNQWYVHHARYNSLDGDNSELRAKWKAWESPLTYISGSFIEPKSLRLTSDGFDITEKDYRVCVKKTTNVDVKRLSSLEATLYTVPSKYSQNREAGIGWTASFTPKADVGSMSFFPVQNFPFRSVSGSDVLEINAYTIAGAEIVSPRGYRIVKYNQSLELSSAVFFDGNASTLYSATVVIDGINSINLDVPGNLVNVREVLDFINTKLNGLAQIRVELGNLVVESGTTGNTSSIDMTIGTLFPNILPVSFGGISDALTTTYAFNRVMYVNGNYTNEFTQGTKFNVTGATTLNGTYTVTKSIFDVSTARTMVIVEESVIPTSSIVDGVIRITTGRTLPEGWVTGKEVYLNSVGTLPLPVDEYTPYYVIRISDTTFKLAETADAAAIGIALTVESSPVNLSYVGELERTFKALGGNTSKYNWRRHAADTRKAITMPSSMSISGIQCMVDFLVGYEEYTKSIGFDCLNPDGDNRDVDTKLSNSWQTETEKFIDWMFTIRTLRHEDNLKYHVTPNSTNNSFTYRDSVNLENGTAILLLPDDGGVLPTRFNNVISQNTPYYVIRSTDGISIQLAASRLDAKKGNAIDFSDNGSGQIFVQVYKKSDNLPRFELNPFKSNLWVSHETGILSNVTDNNIARYPSRQVIFDDKNHIMTVADLHVFREDSRSRIALVGSIDNMNNSKFSYTRLEGTKKPKAKKKYISGVDLRFEGYEHTIIFNDRSVDNALIYDNFLGIRTPRFLTEMTRQIGFTLRPNMGGFILQNGELSPNFESTVSDIRYYYDVHNALEYKNTTTMVRNVLGYNGTIDYMDALQINPKTQFLFWRGMIQNKGTNLAIDAFANQPLFSDAAIDEFWAYKLGVFGDAKSYFYPEVKLTVDDVVKKELRLEFTSPEGGPLDDSFVEIKLTDISRWWNQPDVWNASQPYNTFFFDTKVTGILENVENDVITTTDGRTVLALSDHHDGAIITYRETEDGDVKLFVDRVDFEFINSKIIRFITPLTGLLDVTVATLSYNEQSSGPSFVIDKNTDTIMAEIPIWNPAIGQHSQIGYQVVDVESKTDPAFYSDTLDSIERHVEGVWTGSATGHVWMDTSVADYIPYYDRAIFRSTNERMFNWGQMADWAGIKLYQWTESTIHPDDWDTQVLLDNLDINMPPNKRRGGKSYKKLYKNTQLDPNATPIWVEVKDSHHDYMAILVDANTASELAGNHEVYVNGKYVMDINLTAYTLHQFIEGAVPSQPMVPTARDYIHVIQRAAVPDEEALQKNQYKYATPYSMVERFDPVRGSNYNLYYFWVSDKQEQISLAGNKYTTITEAEKQLTFNPNPYMVINGLRPGDDGYGIVFGTVFDEDNNKLPYRYTQIVIRGLNGKVKDEERYALRVCKDLTLRDSLPSGDGLDSYLSNKNVHSEWKLIREKQIYKIDTFLWDRLVEAAIGCRVVDGTADYTSTLPSLNRIVFDNIYDADTRFGLGDEQVFSDRETTVATLISVLSDPKQEFTRVDISEFLAKYDFSYKSDIVDALAEIYNVFTVEEVNKIFFAVLHDAMAFKRKASDIFKTSWVALQIAQSVHTSGTVDLPQVRLVAGDACGAGGDSDFIEVTPTPLPNPTPTPTPTVSDSATPTPTPTSSTTPTPTPTSSTTPTPSPTSSITPTPTPTPSITPSPSQVLGPFGTGLFSANHNGYISKIRTSDDTVVANPNLTGDPYEIALSHDGTQVYVFDGSSGVKVLSAITLGFITSIALVGGSNGVARHPTNNEIYVSTGTSVKVLSTTSNTFTDTITGFTSIAFTTDIVFSNDGSKAYVTGYNDTTSYVFVIDTATKTITNTITVGTNQSALSINTDGSLVYGCSRAEGKFYVIDTATNAVTTTATLGFPITGCIFHPTNGLIYVTDANGFVKVLNNTTYSVVANVAVGATPVYPIFNYDYTKVYVPNYNGSSISVIATDSNTVVSTIPLSNLAAPNCLAIARP